MTQRNDSSGSTRRHFLRFTPAALAAGAVTNNLFNARAARADDDRACRLVLAPRYYPLEDFEPEIDIAGKLAVITGASRGIGRATADALTALGADVIGTSRDVASVPDPPHFPLLDLDISDDASVGSFVASLAAHPLYAVHGQVDILINNAARVVVGQIAPLPPTTLELYLAQRALGMKTVYSGHVLVTNAMIPLMPTQGYARILFTTSIAAYQTGAASPTGNGLDVYNSAKSALLGYANNLATFFELAGSSLRVSTVNPYLVATGLLDHPTPIYTQPVNDEGLSDFDPIFNQGITMARQEMAGGLPASLAGDAYAQLLRMLDPTPNVLVASAQEPFATMGKNEVTEAQLLAENQQSAIPFAVTRTRPKSDDEEEDSDNE